MATKSDAAALRDVSGSTESTHVGGSVALRYVARAGLLPELSRQTYDSFPKALREAVLNGLDAEATRVDIDFSEVETTRQITVRDDGVGMSMSDFCEQFMSLGGSSKFGDNERFGRIGIGSLALLQYAEAAVIKTKRAGAQTGTEARIQHPWNLGRDDRRTHLGEMSAGFAEEYRYEGEASDHFTEVTLENVNPDVWEVGQDPSAFYELIENLRRILPLPWGDSRLSSALEASSPDLVALLRDHIREWSAPVFIHSGWERNVELHRRSYGDDRTGLEDWSGPPMPLLKTVRIPGLVAMREITLAGFLLNQKRARAEWTGLTARVQNVAVEEHSFFDVTSDPGFRKYISGEVWLLGDVDRERLINIDRSSFNRECIDYHVVQRVMSRAIVEFKSQGVQRPQRQKVAVRRVLEDHARSLKAIEKVANRAAETSEGRLPSSEWGRTLRNRHGVREALEALDTEIVINTEADDKDRSYGLDLSEDGLRVKATVGTGLLEPTIRVGDVEYQVMYAAAGPDDPPVVIRSRPRVIVFNTGHAAYATGDRARKFELSLALELAYLLDNSDAASVYRQMVNLLEVM